MQFKEVVEAAWEDYNVLEVAQEETSLEDYGLGRREAMTTRT